MRRRMMALCALVLALVLVVIVAVADHGERASAQVRTTLSLATTLGGADTAGFARAIAPRVFHFPQDHGPHPGFRNEWWYFTGNLVAPGGRVFGYELTFFRTALTADSSRRASDWATRDVYMAHFAITDSAAGRFRARDRFARGAVGLAGADPAPWRVWLEDWRAKQTADTVAPSAFWPVSLTARDSGMALDLTLGEGKPPVLQGDRGLSRKGPEPGDASYYYSLTRMPTSGWLEIGGRRYRVAGDSWMDREWSTSALGRDEVGWDWFALRLSDGRELMLYRIRRRDGRTSPYSAGTLVGRDGRSQGLAAGDVAIDVLRTWSSSDGARYPAQWRIRVPAAGLDLQVRPVLADQELKLAFRYWEGAVAIAGSAAGKPVEGRGYVELTGYAAEGGQAGVAGQGRNR